MARWRDEKRRYEQHGARRRQLRDPWGGQEQQLHTIDDAGWAEA